MYRITTLLLVAAVSASSLAFSQIPPRLRIYHFDVNAGDATLFLSPDGLGYWDRNGTLRAEMGWDVGFAVNDANYRRRSLMSADAIIFAGADGEIVWGVNDE